MSVFRINKNSDYTTMSNFHLKDKRLTLKAKGLLSVMLSLSDEWNYSVAGLCSISKENETAINSALKELKDCGYLIVSKERGIDGKFEYNYDIFERPTIENPPLENPPIENMGVANNINNINNNKVNTKDKILNNKKEEKEISVINNTKEKSGFHEGYDENGEYHSFFENDDNFKEIPKPEEKPKTDSEKVYDYFLNKAKYYGYAKKDVKPNESTLKNISKYLKEYDLIYIEQTIDRYFQVISDKSYYFDTYWNAEKFFKQGNAFKDFTEEGNKWINYNLARNKVNPYKS